MPHKHEWETCPLGDTMWVFCKCGMDVMIRQDAIVVTDFNAEHSQFGYEPLGRIDIEGVKV